MSGTWNPRLLLDVDPENVGFTCVGITKQGLRCRQSFTSNASLYEARDILDDMGRISIYLPDFINHISPRLDRLAEMTLCPRWHRSHNYGNCQRPQVHKKWMNTVSAHRHNMIAATTQATSLLYVPAHVFPTPPVTLSQLYDIPSPLTQYQTELSPSSNSPSVASAANTTPSFNDSGYSTVHSTRTSASELPLNDPATILPSPPSSIWSMDPPSPTLPSPRSSSSATTVVAQTPVSVQTPSQSTSTSATHTQSATFIDALATALVTALAATPSSPSGSTSSTDTSSTSSSTHHRSSRRSSERSSRTNNHVATALATSVATVLAEHLTVALARELAPALRSVLDTQRTSRHSSTRSSHRSTSSTAASTEDSRPSRAPEFETPPLINPISPPRSTRPPLVSTEATPPPSLPPRPVIRKPLTDPCYVCVLPIDSPDDAVWCRASCGQNLHVECFNAWAESQLDEERDIRCAFCRTLWV